VFGTKVKWYNDMKMTAYENNMLRNPYGYYNWTCFAGAFVCLFTNTNVIHSIVIMPTSFGWLDVDRTAVAEI
jgi:hypothetical protein